MDDGLSESLTKIAEGFVGAFSHLDRCIHEVKDDVSELKDDVKRIEDGMGRMEDDFTEHRKLCNDVISKRIEQNASSS